jgi:hypothetical protein
VRIDLHGYCPSELRSGPLAKIVQQCWEMGETHLRVIYGDGRMRGKSPGFYNTKTGVLGLAGIGSPRARRSSITSSIASRALAIASS